MALKVYTVDINGIEHTVKLSAEDAKKYPDAREVKAAQTPANKSRTAQNK